METTPPNTHSLSRAGGEIREELRKYLMSDAGAVSRQVDRKNLVIIHSLHDVFKSRRRYIVL